MGMGIGAAMTGLRPIIEGMNMGFLLLAYNQISNNAGMLHYTSGGQFKVSASHRKGRQTARPALCHRWPATQLVASGRRVCCGRLRELGLVRHEGQLCTPSALLEEHSCLPPLAGAGPFSSVGRLQYVPQVHQTQHGLATAVWLCSA